MTEQDPRRFVLPLVVGSGAAFIAGLDNLVVTTALVRIQESLGTDLAGLTWTINSYTLTFAVLMLGAAALGDRIGRRRVFRWGVLLFTVASAAIALSPSLAFLNVFRGVQGLGAAVLVPLSLILVVDSVPQRKRTMAVAIWSAAQGLAVSVGPLVGGLIVGFLDWQWIFWVNVPIGLVVVATASVFRDDAPRTGGRFDVPGLVLLTAALLGLVLGLINGVGHGWGAAPTLLPLAAGVLGAMAFLAWERRATRPILPLGLFAERGFTLTNLNALLLTAGVFGSVFLLMQYLQKVLAYTPVEAGVRTLPWTLLPAVAAPISGALAERHGTRPIMIAGSLLQGAALAWFALVVDEGTSYLALLPGMVAAGAGMGAFFAVVATQSMAFAPPGREGIASGVTNAVREIGVLAGVAALATVFLGAGGRDTPDGFVSGLPAALWVGAAGLALASLLAFLTPRPSPTGPREETPSPSVEHV